MTSFAGNDSEYQQSGSAVEAKAQGEEGTHLAIKLPGGRMVVADLPEARSFFLEGSGDGYKTIEAIGGPPLTAQLPALSTILIRPRGYEDQGLEIVV